MNRFMNVFIAVVCLVIGANRLHAAGEVWAWGRNNWGQLGDNTQTSSLEPVQTHILTNVIAIAAGVEHSLALKSDSTVWAWGHNDGGQLGDSTRDWHFEPVQTHISKDIIAIAASDKHSLALKSDGTVWGWGDNYWGELGDGTYNWRLEPVQAHIVTNVIAIAAGVNHSLALKSDGTVWAWGTNWYGQLGDGTQTHRLEPVQVHTLSNVNAIAVGGSHSLAVMSGAGIEESENDELRYTLHAYPNPFRSEVNIKYSIGKTVHITLRVYDVAGNLIKTLVDEKKTPDSYTVCWDCRDDKGRAAPSGIYFYKIQIHTGPGTRGYKSIRKMILLK